MIPTDPIVTRRLFCYLRWLEEVYGPAEGWMPVADLSGFAWYLTDSDDSKDIAFRLVLRSRSWRRVGVAPGTTTLALAGGSSRSNSSSGSSSSSGSEPTIGIVLEVRRFDDFLASEFWLYYPGHYDAPPNLTSEAGVAWIRAKALEVRRYAEVRTASGSLRLTADRGCDP